MIMIFKRIQIVAGSQSRTHGSEAVRVRLKLRPRMMELEGRALLSTLTVSSNSDSGPGSLRAAIAQANSDGGGDTILFASLFNSKQTIILTSGGLHLTPRVTTTIKGPRPTCCRSAGTANLECLTLRAARWRCRA